MAHVSQETREKIENLTKILIEERGPSFFELRVRPQDKYLRECADKDIKTKYNQFIKGHNDHLAYIQEKRDEYEEMMKSLRSIPSFTRIISQNMHLRNQGVCAWKLSPPCKGDSCFKDNQVARALALGNAIKNDKLSFDILCLQEVQHDEARIELLKILNQKVDNQNKPIYGFVYDQGTVVASISKISEGAFGVQQNETAGTLQRIASSLPSFGSAGRLNVLPETPEEEENNDPDIFKNPKALQQLYNTYKGTINSGLMIIYKKARFEAVGTPYLYHFPSLFSSGADRISAGVRSFKGALFLRLQDKQDPTRTILLCNTHPSPYVTVPQKSARSKYDWEVKLTHVYQLTLVAMQMKKIANDYSKTNQNKKEFLFTCGDMNINKYIQTGSMHDVPSRLFEELEKAKPKTNAPPSPTSSNLLNTRNPLEKLENKVVRGVQKGFEKVEQLKKEYEELRKEFKNFRPRLAENPFIRAAQRPLNTDTTKCGSLYDLPLGKKTMFARSTPTELYEACFRDDVPYISNYCDIACCGSEYLTIREILAGVAPAHLVSLPEYKDEVVAPLHGKYTWDGLFNSVVFSPHWSSMSFQLIDHFFYNAFGRIPSYAHVMTKRYICDPPVDVTEGPLSKGCYKEAPCAAKTKRFDFGEATPQGETVQFLDYKYYDLADHYAIECCLVLDESDETIKQITEATTKPMNQLTDKNLKEVIINLVKQSPVQGKRRTGKDTQNVSQMNLGRIGLNEWRVLRGFRLLPDNLPNQTSKQDLEDVKAIFNRAIFYPRRWFYSLETPDVFKEKNKTIYIPNGAKTKEMLLLDRRYSFLSYANTLFRPEQYLNISFGKDILRSENRDPFTWRSYLPDQESISTDLVEFQQFAVKAFNRMLERETFNRMWQKKGEWHKYTKEVYMNTDLTSPDCVKTGSKTLHKCVTFKNKPSQKNKNKTKNERIKIIRTLNTQKVNTLQNAKGTISKNNTRKHSKQVAIPELELQGIRSGNALYVGAPQTEYVESKPITQRIGNRVKGATGAVTGAIGSVAKGIGSFFTGSTEEE